ncbi:MAG: FliA/WhiG family RNA polymerase sigma factor [Gemmatimonadota bacterium]
MHPDDLWSAYRRGDLAAREALLAQHLSLVHHVARQLTRSLAVPADFDELVSCGTLGLMNALSAFDATRGLAFSTFAVPRIRGAMLDELRRQDHVPRSVRRKTRDLAMARENLTRIFGRPATNAELAEHLGIDEPTLRRWQVESEGAMHLSLDYARDDENGESHFAEEALASDDDTSPEALLNREQERALLARALTSLKEQERVVLTLYYFEDLKLQQIAQVLELTESRISQIRTKALEKLRAALTPQTPQVNHR